MKNARIVLISVFVIVFAAILVFGGPGKSFAEKTMISIGGGGRAMSVTAGGMADFINKNLTDVQASARGTGASFDNMKLLGLKSIDFGLSSSIVAFKAINAISPFKTPIKNVRFVGLIWASEFNVLVKKNSGIKCYGDLKGKRIAGGAVGTGMLQASTSILPKIFEIKPGDIKTLGYKPATYALKDNRIDAMAVQGPPPFPTIIEIMTTEDILILSMTEDEQTRLVNEFPYYAKNTMPAGVYPKQDYPVSNVKNPCYIAAREDTPEDLVYRVTKVLYSREGLAYMGKVHRIFKSLTQERALDYAMQKQLMPFHPGALRFYKELAKELGK